MQPKTLAITLTLLPLLAANGAYLLSAYEGSVPWCMPYIEGCTTVSRAGRSGNSIFLFRVVMMVYSVLLIWFWIYSKHWLDLLYGHGTAIARVILWLGLAGMLSLLIYIDFLGTSGELNRFMRRFGILFYFTLTPLAQLLLLNQHYKIINKNPAVPIKRGALQYQLVLLLVMLILGILNSILAVTQHDTYASENIVEWNFSLLMTLYFSGMVLIWKDYRYTFTIKAAPH